MSSLMTDILKNSSRMPGVSLENNPNSTVLLLNQENGRGRMAFYPLFPGLTLAFIDIRAFCWPESEENASLKPLLINFCVSGRSELLLDDNTYIYLKEQDYCLSLQTAQREYIFPTGHYQGLKLYFDLSLFPEACQPLLASLELDFFALANRYCGQRKTYLSRASGALLEYFDALWSQRESPSLFRLRMDSLELVHCLLSQKSQPSSACGFYTGIQVEIAKKAHALLTADLKNHYPLRLIAQRFAVSETSLKNYFRGVYGQNVSACLREARMKKAAGLLAETRLPIADIAQQVGYSNQGKFAAVFKRQFGLLPLEYRRRRKLGEK